MANMHQIKFGLKGKNKAGKGGKMGILGKLITNFKKSSKCRHLQITPQVEYNQLNRPVIIISVLPAC